MGLERLLKLGRWHCVWIVLLKRILISLYDVAGFHVAVAHDHG